VEFIYAALRNMEHFGVHRDLASYKKLMAVFPKGKMIPDNRLVADFFHYPKHQQCAVRILGGLFLFFYFEFFLS
jgi:signaling intermediate in Toll pathway protein